ncbi:MAG: sulfite exporter TauE/SafE family protein [Flavobacteriales bacterium]|jgi:uncharacterized membrane protein YfcA
MVQEHILFALFALICEIIGTVGGFGSSILFVPLASLVLPRGLVLGLTSILHVFSNLSKIFFFYKHINRRILLLFGIPSVLFTIVGAWITTSIGEESAQWLLGIFLVVFSLLFLLFPALIIPANKINAIAGGSLAGFAAGFLGTGGAIRGMTMAAFDMPMDVFVGTSAAIDLGVDFTRMLIYAGHGFMEDALWSYVVILFIASWAGTWIGKLILDKMTQEQFKRVVLLLILAIGLTTLAGAAGLI